VLEIGCGNGRDAVAILEKTKNYIGIDLSEELIKLARLKAQTGVFEVADVEEYSFPKNLDIIFSFASLLHSSKEELKNICTKALDALTPGGVFRISLKNAEKYTELTRDDALGTRTFYLYAPSDIEECVEGFTILRNEVLTSYGQEWLEVLLKK
jgi:SAM-dependent methyltransferase